MTSTPPPFHRDGLAASVARCTRKIQVTLSQKEADLPRSRDAMSAHLIDPENGTKPLHFQPPPQTLTFIRLKQPDPPRLMGLCSWICCWNFKASPTQSSQERPRRSTRTRTLPSLAGRGERRSGSPARAADMSVDREQLNHAGAASLYIYNIYRVKIMLRLID